MLPFFGKNFSNTYETIENALIFMQNEIGLYAWDENCPSLEFPEFSLPIFLILRQKSQLIKT